jgi:hypothetical protein
MVDDNEANKELLTKLGYYKDDTIKPSADKQDYSNVKRVKKRKSS